MLGNGSDDDDLGFGGIGDDDDLGFGGLLPEDELPVIPGFEEESKSSSKPHDGGPEPLSQIDDGIGPADGPSKRMGPIHHDVKVEDPEREPARLLEAEEAKVPDKQKDGFKPQPAKAKNTLRNLFVEKERSKADDDEDDPLLLGDAVVVDELLPDDLDYQMQLFDLENLASQAERPQDSNALMKGSSLQASSLLCSPVMGQNSAALAQVAD